MIVVGGWPGRNVIGLNGRFGVRPAGFAVGGSFDNPLLNDADPGDETTEFVLVVASLPASGTVVLDDTGGFEHTGAADGTHITTATLYTWAQGGPLTTHSPAESITSTFGAGGTTATITGAGGIPSAEAVGTPALTATGGGGAGVITGAGGIASAEAVGTPTLSASLWPVVSPPGIPSAEAVGTPTLIVVAAEFDEPVTVAEAKLAARMDADTTVLDEEVAVAISAARQQAELITGRRYRPTVVVYELATWPLPTEPLSVHAARACAIDYWDGAAWQTLPPSEYVFAPGGIGGNATCLAPQLDRRWPALGDVAIGPRVRVSLTCGPVTRQAVPAAVKLFIKAHVSAWMNSDSLVPQNMVLNPVLVRILDAERLWC